MQSSFDRDLNWTLLNMPQSSRAVGRLPSLQGVRLALSTHLDIKMIPAIQGFLEKGAKVFLTTCNPKTVRNEVVEHLRSLGAQSHAWKDMTAEEYSLGKNEALAWGPTHLCEMGADLTTLLHQDPKHLKNSQVRASLEGTGSGIHRITNAREFSLGYPIFNWDDISVKEGLHNRFMVGLMTCAAFLAKTKLTFHGKNVLVIGYGLVGRGMADSARAFGGNVTVVEANLGRGLEASYRGWARSSLEEGLPSADVVITATGARSVLQDRHFALLKDGAFLINVGHANEEIDVPSLLAHPYVETIPFVKSIQFSSPPSPSAPSPTPPSKKKTIHLFSDGAMANLVAGDGDPLNAFDTTLAVMIAGVGHITGGGQNAKPGCHLLPEDVWSSSLG